MKTNVALFGGIGLFALIVAFVYGFVTGFEELAGFPLLLLTGGLGVMLWFYLGITAKNTEQMDGDDPSGEIHQMTGNYGEFAPWSWWPLGLGLACALLVLGLAVDWWVFFLALIPGLFFLVGWVMEYNRKRYAH